MIIIIIKRSHIRQQQKIIINKMKTSTTEPQIKMCVTMKEKKNWKLNNV